MSFNMKLSNTKTQRRGAICTLRVSQQLWLKKTFTCYLASTEKSSLLNFFPQRILSHLSPSYVTRHLNKHLLPRPNLLNNRLKAIPCTSTTTKSNNTVKCKTRLKRTDKTSNATKLKTQALSPISRILMSLLLYLDYWCTKVSLRNIHKLTRGDPMMANSSIKTEGSTKTTTKRDLTKANNRCVPLTTAITWVRVMEVSNNNTSLVLKIRDYLTSWITCLCQCNQWVCKCLNQWTCQCLCQS